MVLEGKTVLVTGGTGSFGQKFAEIVLKEQKPRAIRVFSRGELLQYEMRQKFNGDEKLRFFIGDVRDRERVYRAVTGADVIVHAAALKQVPACEYNPIEAVRTNIDGAINVIDAAIDTGVEKVIAISTDKAVHPVNLYGATKLVAERLFTQANVYTGAQRSRFSCVRYGNVIGSRGSIHCFEPVPEFFAILENNVKISNLQVPVFLNPVAVSDTISVATMLVDSGKSRLINTATSGTETDLRKAEGQFIEVRTVTLDHYIREKEIARIDFIKLDIEGHELWGLKGLRNHLESGGRPTILTEVGWEAQTENREELFSYLESFGYKAYRFRKRRLIPIPHPDALAMKGPDDLGGGRTSLNVAWICEKADMRC